LKSSDALRVAILQTDEVMPEFVGHHGTYPDMFASLLERAARDRDPQVDVRLASHDVRVGQFPEAGDHDGYVITGSRKSVYDAEPWIAGLADFVKEVLQIGGRVIGICFGHQLIAHFFGGETRPAPGGWAVGVQESRTIANEPWMTPGGQRLNLLASHKDQVHALPDGARLIATSDFCPIGGFVMGAQVMTLQGHPEFHRDYSRDLMVMRRELLGEETFNDGISSLAKETDEDKVGHWMINFLGERNQAQ